MMNAESSAHNHKDFFNAFFQVEQPPGRRLSLPDSDIFQSHQLPEPQHQLAVMNSQQQTLQSNGVSIEVLEGLMGMQERGGQQVVASSGVQPTPQILMEHQMRLSQLQQLYQLQTQIFQQQIELLSGQTSLSALPLMVDRSREQQQYLPTPATSVEIPPQPSPDYVPPMMLQSSEHNTGNVSQQSHPSFVPQHVIPSAPHSAPANIVFQNIQSPYPLPSPAELEFDEMSPLTSPWLGAYNTSQPSTNSGSRSTQQGPSGGTKRRTVSPSSDELNPSSGRPSRKRQAAVNRIPPSVPSIITSRKPSLRGTKSANSTPLFPAVSSRSSGSGSKRSGPNPLDIPGDTPSPVDLSMPPPATPQPLAPMNFLQSSTPTIPGNAPTPTSASQEHISPVTPASIMNLGRLGAHGPGTTNLPQSTQSPSMQPQDKGSKSRGTSRPRSATVASQGSSSRGSHNNISMVSPALKPIRPAGNASVGSVSPTVSIGQPTMQVRKTSHKAAEQKRRDSLKTSFDDLRILLPPIPLPSEDGFDEPILPGAMPPRGPPKGNADGPNRGVSKLQLLRCGNDYIRRLHGRVERRDQEIETLRAEIARLRLVVGNDSIPEDGQEPIDLIKDLDAVEMTLPALGRYPGALLGDGDDDEE